MMAVKSVVYQQLRTVSHPRSQRYVQRSSALRIVAELGGGALLARIAVVRTPRHADRIGVAARPEATERCSPNPGAGRTRSRTAVFVRTRLRAGRDELDESELKQAPATRCWRRASSRVSGCRPT